MMSTGTKRHRARSEKLIPPQRHSFILDVLQEQGSASIQQLSERLGASFSTVRRDLDELASRRFVRRTHGGAILVLPADRLAGENGERASREVRAIKESIGVMAASRIGDGDSVIFDSSTTVLEAARAVIGLRLRVTAVTNNLKIADVLGSADTVRLIVPGGTRRAGTFALFGEPGESFFNRLHADIALIGAQSASGGKLTDSRIDSASSKRLLMSAGRRRILLIDSWKFGGPGLCDVASLAEFDEVITDDGLVPEQRAQLERLGIDVTMIPVNLREDAATTAPGRSDPASAI